MATFDKNILDGEAGEPLIAQWLRRKGYTVLPAYEKIVDSGKGPRLYLPRDVFIAPDFLAFSREDCAWIEAKRKTAFSWHRITSEWVTGIDLRHYEDYCRVDEETPWPVLLFFLQEGGQAKDSPPDSPAGLFGGRLSELRNQEHHRHANWGRGGMVYWAIDVLQLYAKIDEFTPELMARIT